MSRFIPALALLVLATASSLTQAAVSFAYMSDQTTYSAPPNTSVVINVYLRETRPDTGTPSLLVAESGLFGYDISISRAAGAATITALSPNSAQFTDLLSVTTTPSPIPAGGTTFAAFSVSALDEVGPTGTAAGLTRSILLGTFTLKTPATFGSTSQFTLANWPPTTNTLTNLGTPLDSLISPLTLTLNTPVPEPTTMFLLSPLLPLLARRRLR